MEEAGTATAKTVAWRRMCRLATVQHIDLDFGQSNSYFSNADNLSLLLSCQIFYTIPLLYPAPINILLFHLSIDNCDSVGGNQPLRMSGQSHWHVE